MATWSVEYAPANIGNGDFWLESVSGLTGEAWSVGNDSGPAMIAHGPPWSHIAHPPSGIHTRLKAVVAIPQGEVWAVGSTPYRDQRLNYSVSFDGTSWNEVPTPLPHDGINELQDVAASSLDDIWAVGYTRGITTGPWSPVWGPPLGAIEPQALRWDGASWDLSLWPRDSGIEGEFNGVAAISRDDYWAVGEWMFTGPQPYLDGLLMHWDGKSWTQVRSPTPEVNTVLWSVAGTSADDVWAVGELDYPQGRPHAIHWNGTNWSVVKTPAYGERALLESVACADADDVWAVGTRYENGYQHKLIFHWDGTSWTEMKGPDIGDQDHLIGVSVGPDGTVWACGYYAEPSSSYQWSIGYTIPMVLGYR